MMSKPTREQPLVSIVTPSFNQARFIEEAILSVQAQDYPFIEHIIIDGASTDETLAILKKHENTFNLRWISEPDEGHADAVNKGFALAQGEIIGWLNSDDVYFDKKTISAVVSAFQEHPEADIVYGDCAYIWEDGTILKVQCVPGFRYSRLQRGCFLEQPAVFFRKHVVDKHKLDKSLKIGIDYEYWLRLGKQYKFYKIPRILAADRNHGERISIVQSTKLKETAVQLRNQYIGKPSIISYLGWQLDKIFSGIPRRLKGLVKLLQLTRKKDFAFNAHVALKAQIIKNQLLSRKVEQLHP